VLIGRPLFPWASRSGEEWKRVTTKSMKIGFAESANRAVEFGTSGSEARKCFTDSPRLWRINAGDQSVTH
jgi:hypothetical protein